MSFERFSQKIHNRFSALSLSGELFVTVPGDEVWAAYLAAFPEGTNEIYRERTEHDCSCCRNFIRNLGNVVTVAEGQVWSVWSGHEELEHPYNVVAAALDELVTKAAITGLFRSDQHQYGAPHSFETLANGDQKKWNHFYGRISADHFSKQVAKDVGEYATKVQVFQRGLEELKPEALAQVLELIDGKALYRGDEFRALVHEFQTMQNLYLTMDASTKHLFIWQRVCLTFAAGFRNTVIGTLAVDLSDGKELEAAVASFEAKVAPANYKRTTALITPRMVEDAMKTIRELNLEPALERRLARLDDVSVNNVLWVDGSVRGKMKGGVEGLLMAAATKSAPTKALDIGIDAFMADVLPTAKGIDLYLRNDLQTNLMTLTAPVHEEVEALFKWDNNFAWSYNGNITDSELRKAVQARGGRVDGVFRFSHSWNYGKRNASLMDLHVFFPTHNGHQEGCHDYYGNHERVGWNQRRHQHTGGIQDVDYTHEAPEGYIPVENITFPDVARMPEGTYICKIHNWRLRAPTQGGFKAEIEFGGQIFEYEVDRPLKNKEWITVAEVTLKNGAFTIEHKLPCGQVSQKVWGLDTEEFVKVQTVMFSPNHWDDQAVGNKHWFFMLDGAKTQEPARGIYNEYLKAGLEKHRKVFEVLGSKTMCPPTDEQLSGIGFSSTRRASVMARVAYADRTVTYNINF